MVCRGKTLMPEKQRNRRKCHKNVQSPKRKLSCQMNQAEYEYVLFKKLFLTSYFNFFNFYRFLSRLGDTICGYTKKSCSECCAMKRAEVLGEGGGSAA